MSIYSDKAQIRWQAELKASCLTEDQFYKLHKVLSRQEMNAIMDLLISRKGKEFERSLRNQIWDWVADKVPNHPKPLSPKQFAKIM